MNAAAQFTLTDRDLAIIDMAFIYGGCSISHLQTRFFPTPGSRSPCYTRIAKLVEAELLASRRLPSQTGVGSGPLFLTVGSTARPLLANLLGCSQSELRRQSRMHAPAPLYHHLATCDFRLSLDLACERSKVITGVEWTPEWELRRRPIRVEDNQAGTTIVLIADGLFRLMLGDGSEQAFLVEIDMGTMTDLKRLRSKLRGYLLAAKTEPVPILFVTTTKARQEHLVHLAAGEGQRLKADTTIFWFTTQGAVTPESILSAPIWHVVGGPERMRLTGINGKPTATPATSQLVLAEGVHT